MSLKLIGNMTWDKIYYKDTLLCERGGAIMNITRNLRVPYSLYCTSVTQCVVHLGDNDNKSYDLSNRNQDLLNQNFHQTRRAHISYLDQINIQPNHTNSEIISADLCATSYSDFELADIFKKLMFVDELIISENELSALRVGIEVLKGLVRGLVILRTRNSIQLHSRYGRYQEWPNYFLEVKNPVGAGDAFVAEFLNQFEQQLYFTRMDEPPSQLGYQEIIPKCVEASMRFLTEQNEEI